MKYTPAASRYSNPDFYKRCGNSGLKLPRLSLGLWQNFGDNLPLDNSRTMVLRAFDLGITHFDLANNYGVPAGSAEANFGRVLANDLHAYRDELVISTKAGYYMWEGPYGDWGSRKYLTASLDQSLKRLGLDYVDIFYSHRPDPETPLEETMGALHSAVQSGKALYVGISNYPVEQTIEAVSILRDLGTRCLIHQPYYNMFDRTIEHGLLDALKENGMGCIPFCPLAQGLLTNRYLNGIPEDSRGAQAPQFVTEKLDRVRKLNTVAEAGGRSLAQLALVWILRQPTITSALIGASKVSQIEDNVKALEKPELTNEEIEEIDKILEG